MGFIDTITTKKVIDPDGTTHYLTVQPWDTWIEYQTWIFDSYPHDERWEASCDSLRTIVRRFYEQTHRRR